MPSLMLIRTKLTPEYWDGWTMMPPAWTAWIEGQKQYGVAHGPTQTEAVEQLVTHITTIHLRDSLRKSLEQVTA